MQTDLDIGGFVPTAGSHEALEFCRSFVSASAGAPWVLLLHGPCGVGKTFLLEAMLRSLRAREAGGRVVLTTATDLVLDLIAAFRAHDTGASARVHAPARHVLVDDLHSLSDRPATQREVGVWAADLLARGGRLACTAASPPATIADLVERLAALPGARVVEMRRPTDREMRRILVAKARSAGVSLDSDSIGSIAARCEGDVRRAEGAINLHRFRQGAGILPGRSFEAHSG